MRLYDPRTSERTKHHRAKLEPDLVILIAAILGYFGFALALAVFFEWWD